MTAPTALEADACRLHVEASAIAPTTEPGSPLDRLASQRRAIRALRHGLGLRTPGTNVAVVGPRGTGRTFLAMALAREEAARRPTPDDLLLLPNPRGPLEPIPVTIPAGAGPRLVRALEDLHATFEAALHDVLEGDARNRLALEVQQQQSREEKVLHQRLADLAASYGLGLVTTDGGFEFIPTEGDEGAADEDEAPDPATRDQLALPGVETEEEDAAAHNRRFLEAIEQLTPHVEEVQRELTMLEVQAAADLQARQRTTLRRRLAAAFQSLPADVLTTDLLRDHVRTLHAHLLDVYHLHEDDTLPPATTPLEAGLVVPTLLTSRAPNTGAPLVHARNPTLARIFGRMVTGPEDTRYPPPGTILPGDLHHASGGFLVIEAEALVQRPRVYEHLKSCLLARQILPLEEGEGQLLRPHALDLDVKVILIADAPLLSQLQDIDPEFSHLFKVRADFAAHMTVDEACRVYPHFCAWLAEHRDAPTCSPDAVARLVEHGARLAEDQQRVTTQLGRVENVVTEAAQLAREAREIGREHIDAALEMIRERDGLLREEMLELHRRGTVRVRVSGTATGQVNGLAVVSDGFSRVGRPLRVSAVTFSGKGRTRNIDREVHLSGPVHDKGVLILSGYLSGRFAHDAPLAMSASVVFEQSYGPVEGDSASVAELIAILSSLSGCPVRQSVAVTGSVDQLGNVSSVGGINDKIEGWFDLCQALGDAEDPGVLIPSSNAQHLMLRPDVCQAIADGTFQVWTCDRVEEAVELLLGAPAGEPDAEGRWPPGSVFAKVASRLELLRASRRERPPPHDD